jgi:LytR cell envelope-related transcriptional attenuator
VQLEVLNGSGTNGLAGTTATGLSGRGFNVIGTGDAANFGYTSSVIQYSSTSQMPEVNTLKKEVPGVQVQKASGLQPGTIALVIGSKFTGLTGGTAKKGPSVATLNTNNYQTITANQNICTDKSAFSGPLSPVPTPSG